MGNKKKKRKVKSLGWGPYAPVRVEITNGNGTVTYCTSNICPVCKKYENYYMIVGSKILNGGHWECIDCGTNIDPQLLDLPEGCLAIGSVNEGI